MLRCSRRDGLDRRGETRSPLSNVPGRHQLGRVGRLGYSLLAGARRRASIRVRAGVLLAAVFALVAVAPPHGAAGQRIVTATSVAAGFQENLSQLQLLSLPGEWGGLSAAQGFTVEMWVQTSNRFTFDTWLFSYSVRDPLKGQAEPNELGLAYTARVQGGSAPYIFYKGTPLIPDRLKLSSSASNSDAGRVGIYSCGHWNHVTATLDYRSGNYSVYLNGTLLYADTYPGEMEPPLPGGQLQLGAHVQTIATQPTLFMASAESSFSVDVFRLYNRTLSAAEVAAGLWAYDPLPGTAASLLLHWRFDTPGVDREEDFSGNGNHGRWGASANLDMPHVYYHSKPEGAVQSQVHRPASVLSTAPVVGASSVSVLAVPGAVVEIILAEPAVAAWGCTLLSLPAVGEVEHVGGGVGGALQVGTLLPNCRVRYVAPTLLSGVAGGLPLASFTFAAEAAGAEGAVAIHSTGPCEPLPLDALEINDSDRFHVLPLGGLCSDGLNPRVQIITPPQGAILASLRPTFNVDKHFGNNVVQNLIQHFVAGDMGAVAQYVQPMLSFPSEVDDAFGVVLLASAPGFTGSASSHMEYRWLSPYANDSAVYRVEVNVEGPSDRIHVLQPLMATNATDGSIDITLTAESGGGAQSPEPDMLFHVTRGPYFGALRQVSEDGAPGEALSRFSLQTPLVEYIADQVPEYTPEWGPAWSSQLTACPNCCANHETCDAQSCAAQFEILADCLGDARSFPIDNLLDGNENTLYKPDCVDCGRHWFVVGIQEPVYLVKVVLILAGVQEHIVSVHGAEEYEGAATAWEKLWHGGEAQPRELSSSDDWHPDLCPHYSTPVRWLRVEYDTAGAPRLPGFAVVAVTGSLARHTSAVHSPENRLRYEPLPGVRCRVPDSIVVAASDCSEWSEGLKVTLGSGSEKSSSPSPGGAGPGEPEEGSGDGVGDPDGESSGEEKYTDVFGGLQEMDVPLHTRTMVTVDLLPVVAHLEPYLRAEEGLEGKLTAEELTVTLRRLDAAVSENIAVFHPDTGAAVPPGEDILLGMGVHELMVEMSISKPEVLSFRAKYGDLVTYSLGLRVTPVCPALSSVFVCATDPWDCVKGCGTDCDRVTFDYGKSVCVLTPPPPPPATDDASGPSWVNAVIGVTVSVVLIAAAMLALFLKTKGLMRLGGPPRQGEMVTLVTTDIHGSTTLWDSYPEQVAHGIALHHECLRASLKECNGYEIATEGDSFKCAFACPEDAICWSTLSQLHLLCAQWDESIEDGGHGALMTREDWANCEAAPVVDKNAVHLINSLAASESMESLRSQLAKGLLMVPEFDPAKVANSAFCRNWCIAKGEEESCTIYGPNTLLLPIFRGLRVRVGIHTGLAEEVEINPVTRRVVYGGQVAKIAKAVSDAPSGGQIVISGDTLAEVRSVHDLMTRVAHLCAGWRHGEAMGDPTMPAAMSVMSLGSHLLSDPPPMPPPPPEEQQASGEIVEAVGSQATLGDGSIRSTLESKTFGEHYIDVTGGSAIKRMSFLNCELPPGLGGESSWNRRSSDLVSSFAAQNENQVGGDIESESENGEARLIEEQLAWEHELRHGVELIMVVPWPLKSRALYYPPVSSKKVLTSAWNMAPAAEGVTILFTFLEGASKLKELGKEVAREALWRLQAVVRSHLTHHNGYEVEVEEGNFVCAFHTASDSVKFATAVQNMLVHMPWSLDVLGQPWASEQRTATNEVIFRGPRLSIGMCTGNAMRVQPCIRTGKMEYYGPIMNHAARVAVAAHGGQVLLHESTWMELRSDGADLAEDEVLYRNMGRHTLKGISRNVYIIQAISARLGSRAFPPIKTKSSTHESDAPVMSIGELDDYLAGVGGMKHPVPRDTAVSGSVKMPDASLAVKSFQKVKLALETVLPTRGRRIKDAARAALGLKRIQTSVDVLSSQGSQFGNVVDAVATFKRRRDRRASAPAPSDGPQESLVGGSATPGTRVDNWVADPNTPGTESASTGAIACWGAETERA